MGVKGLQTFLENYCPEACQEVNIRDLVETYRRETGREPVIVVDGPSCLRPLYGRLDWVYGGQLKEYVELINNFVQAFKALGIHLVFYFDGPTLERKRPVWVQRRHRNLKDVYSVFDMLSRGKSASSLNPRLFQLPAGLGNIAQFAFKDICGCEVYSSIRECDEEIAEYALTQQCFAILGQDTDYVIYEGAQYYLSANHLNLERMTTLNYNRWALARKLRILPTQLPLLATLVGNDIVQADELKSFHHNLCRNPRRRNSRPSFDAIIYQVSNFIRSLPQGDGLYHALPTISRRVFGNERFAAKLNTSIRSYFTQSPSQEADRKKTTTQTWDRIISTAQDLVKVSMMPITVFNIISGRPYESSTTMEDFRRNDLPSCTAALQRLRQCIYGILLHEHPPEGPVVPEWCMCGEDSLREAVSVRPIPVNPDMHPGLLVLWDTSITSPEVDAARWGLFTWAISKQLSPDKLKQLPQRLVPPTAVLFYLYREVQPSFLQEWELEALIVQAVMLPSYDTTRLDGLQVPEVDTRAVQLAAIFMRSSSVVKFLLGSCGYPVVKSQTTPFHYFDGKLFHVMYLKAKSGIKQNELCNDQVDELEQFEAMKSLVLGK